MFVPEVLSAEGTQILGEGLGITKLSVIGLPEALPAAEYQALGVARVSSGPTPHNIALSSFENPAESLINGGVVPADTEMPNNL